MFLRRNKGIVLAKPTQCLIAKNPSSFNREVATSPLPLRRTTRKIQDTVFGIPVLGDWILSFLSPRDTPGAIFVLRNTKRWTTTLAWVRSRVVVEKEARFTDYLIRCRVDGMLHSPTDDDADVAQATVCLMDENQARVITRKEWMKWGQLHRGSNLPAVIHTCNKAATWCVDGKPIRNVDGDAFDALMKTITFCDKVSLTDPKEQTTSGSIASPKI